MHFRYSKLAKETRAKINTEMVTFDRLHGKIMDDFLIKREREYYKFARCENLLQLYEECLDSDYVPKQFRSDKYFVMSEL